MRQHFNKILDRCLPIFDRPRFRYQNSCMNDRWIVERVFPGLRAGYFLEVGAANGIGGSSCYILETEFSWTGLCIEPHPDFFSQLLLNRPRSHCLPVCLAESAGVVEYVIGEDGSLPYLSGIADSLERFKDGETEKILKHGRRIQLESQTLVQVLEQAKAPSVIDYAAFDIEGSELRVLESFPFERYRFRALTLECKNHIWAPITQLLEAKGYREVKNPYNRSQYWERYWLSDPG